MEKLCLTQIFEPSIYQLANMRGLNNISRNHLRSTKKLETEMEKLRRTQILEPSIHP